MQPVNFKRTVASLLAIVTFSLPSWVPSVTSASEDLLEELRNATPGEAQRVENRILNEWSKSGSAAMDLLLKRGRDALELSKPKIAVEHFRALTDHAPEFAEGWHGLALAYFQLERYGPSMDALERTLALNPHHFGALRGVGAVLESVGRPELAYRAYTRVLELHPQDETVKKAVERLGPRVSGKAL